MKHVSTGPPWQTSREDPTHEEGGRGGGGEFMRWHDFHYESFRKAYVIYSSNHKTLFLLIGQGSAFDLKKSPSDSSGSWLRIYGDIWEDDPYQLKHHGGPRKKDDPLVRNQCIARQMNPLDHPSAKREPQDRR